MFIAKVSWKHFSFRIYMSHDAQCHMTSSRQVDMALYVWAEEEEEDTECFSGAVRLLRTNCKLSKFKKFHS